MDLQQARKEVALFMHRTYERGLTTSTGGNISRRYDDRMLITCSSKDKSALTEDDIAIVDIELGENLTPDLKLSIESDMHRLLYKTHCDVNAVVHSHPTYCCLFSASSKPIDTTLIAESWYLLDEVVKIPYRRMGTRELAEIVSKSMNGRYAGIMENHGALTVGKTLLSAFDRMECLEQAAKLTLFSTLVSVNGLDEKKRDEISRMR